MKFSRQMRADEMISWKRYLDDDIQRGNGDQGEDRLFKVALTAYRGGLARMGECGSDACPDLAGELLRGLNRIADSLMQATEVETFIRSEQSLRELLQGWGRQVALHHSQKATDVRDLLLVMSRTAESLGSKDDRVARQIDRVTDHLKSIACLDDVSRMRASVEASARELQDSLTRMTAEGQALIEHLRAEVVTYQTNLEKAERVSSCDSLTGLGSSQFAIS